MRIMIFESPFVKNNKKAIVRRRKSGRIKKRQAEARIAQDTNAQLHTHRLCLEFKLESIYEKRLNSTAEANIIEKIQW